MTSRAKVDRAELSGGKLVNGCLKFRAEVFGKKNRVLPPAVETQAPLRFLYSQKRLEWVYSILTSDIWIYDFGSESFTSLLGDTSPRLKTSR